MTTSRTVRQVCGPTRPACPPCLLCRCVHVDVMDTVECVGWCQSQPLVRIPLNGSCLASQSARAVTYCDVMALNTEDLSGLVERDAMSKALVLQQIAKDKDTDRGKGTDKYTVKGRVGGGEDEGSRVAAKKSKII